jgi:hypothetical protein
MHRSVMSIFMGTTLALGYTHAQTTKNSQVPTFSGTLTDADCRADDHDAKCPLLPTSKTFGIQTPDGKYMKLDSAETCESRLPSAGSERRKTT